MDTRAQLSGVLSKEVVLGALMDFATDYEKGRLPVNVFHRKFEYGSRFALQVMVSNVSEGSLVFMLQGPTPLSAEMEAWLNSHDVPFLTFTERGDHYVQVPFPPRKTLTSTSLAKAFEGMTAVCGTLPDVGYVTETTLPTALRDEQ